MPQAHQASMDGMDPDAQVVKRVALTEITHNELTYSFKESQWDACWVKDVSHRILLFLLLSQLSNTTEKLWSTGARLWQIRLFIPNRSHHSKAARVSAEDNSTLSCMRCGEHIMTETLGYHRDPSLSYSILAQNYKSSLIANTIKRTPLSLWASLWMRKKITL